jgi:predicted HTH transcriptional regulator
MYRKVTIQDIQKLVETQSAERKKSLSLQKEGMEALDGMVNTDSRKGLVIFGVAPDGTIVGIEPGNLDKAQLSLAQHIRTKFDPPLISNIEILECDGNHLILISAERLANTPYHEYDGRAFIREGSSKRQLSLSEKQSLTKRRDRDHHTGPWKCDKCGSLVGMLMSVELTNQGMKKTYKCGCGGEFWPAG